MRCGAAGVGKTGRLVARVAELLDEGAAPQDVLVFAATPNAREQLERRLVYELGERAAGIVVETPRAFELRLLGTESARAFTGRAPRLLLNFETNVLMEDVKTCGLRAGRLKEMLKFFYRSWTELADDDPTWIFTSEELEVHALLKSCLAFSHGMLEAELANFAVNYLRFDEAACTAASVDHVLVDDYQLLCRASQVMTGMLAIRSLWVAGDPCASAEAFESYPYAAGLEEFAAGEGVAVERIVECDRPVETVRVMNALRADMASNLATCDAMSRAERLAKQARLENLSIEQMRLKAEQEDSELVREAVLWPMQDCVAAEGASAGSVESRVFETPEEEIEALASGVEAALAAGVAASDVYVATPNRIWTRAVLKTLDARGIVATNPFDSRALNGDVRSLERGLSQRVLTLVCLVADPTDSVAWRSWCACGDWLANSPGFAALRAIGLQNGTDLHATVTDLLRATGAGSPFDALPKGVELGADERASVERIVAAYREGMTYVGKLEGLVGNELVQTACALVLGDADAPVPPVIAQLFKGGSDVRRADAAALLDSAFTMIEDVGFSRCAANAVRVGGLELLSGLSPKRLFVSGFVNGFMPRHTFFDDVSTSDQRRCQIRAAEGRRLYSAVGCCTGDVVFTSFRMLDALQAERLDLKIDRFRMKDGRRCAVVSPSVMLDSMDLRGSGGKAPTARATGTHGLLDRLENARIVVRQDRCVTVRNRNARCSQCIETCALGCISFASGELVIAPDACVGCGVCATVCPTCPLNIESPSDAELLERCLNAVEADDGMVCIACSCLLEAKAGAYDAQKVVGLPCLGRVEESLLAKMAARGVKRVVLAGGSCDSCACATGLRVAQGVCSTANLLFDVWGSSSRVEVMHGLPAYVRMGGEAAASAEGGFYDAIGGLAALSSSCGSKGAQMVEGDGAAGGQSGVDAPAKPRRPHVAADGTLPHFTPERHENLLDALAELGEPTPEVEVDTRLWGHVTIDVDACESCRMCAVFCPTGAIAKLGDSEGEGAFGIEYFPGDCVKCRCCENICPARALKVHDGIRVCDLLDGVVRQVELRPVRVQKGGARSIVNSMRALLGMDEVYER